MLGFWKRRLNSKILLFGSTMALASGCHEVPLEQPAADDAGAETERATGTASPLAASEVVYVPLAMHFVYDRFDAATGLPAFLGPGNVQQTILDIDQSIALLNAQLEAARGGEARRLQLLRVSTRYVPSPAAPGPLDPHTTMEPGRVGNAINLLLTFRGDGVATKPWAARTAAGALPHEVGHTLGLWHVFDGNSAPDTVELLYRDLDPASPTSCYRRGDSACDTPPDYGFAHADGTAPNNTCATQVPGMNLCVQDGPPCVASDFVVDQRVRSNGEKICTPINGGTMGRRVYDPYALGLIIEVPNNTMAYHQQGFFTRGQFIRMHDYVQWRLGAANRIPVAERSIVQNLWSQGAGTPWDRAVPRDSALANVVTQQATFSVSGPISGTGISRSATFSLGDARSLFSVRLNGTLSGTPSASFAVTITPPGGAPIVVGRSGVLVNGSTFTVDDSTLTGGASGTSLASELTSLRTLRTHGTWTVNVRDTGASVSIGSFTLSVFSRDRAPLANDRYGRGFGDVLAFRASQSRFWISTNVRNGTPQFNGGVYEAALPTAPWPGNVIMGDLDGDGTVDLLSRNGGQIRVAFGSQSYAAWHFKEFWGANNLPETDLPSASDEVLIADFDGDGFGDLMRRTQTNTSGIWKYNRGFGDGAFGPTELPLLGSSNVAYAKNLKWTVGDFNADGRADILLRYAGGLFWLSRNITASPGTVPVFYGGSNPVVGGSYFAYEDQDRLMAMDVNGDGRDDIVVRRPSNNTWITSTNVNDLLFNGGVSMTIGGALQAYEDGDLFGGALP